MISYSATQVEAITASRQRVYGWEPPTGTFANQSALDQFLVDNSISSSQWLQIVQNLGYANQAEVDAALEAGSLTESIILTAHQQL